MADMSIERNKVVVCDNGTGYVKCGQGRPLTNYNVHNIHNSSAPQLSSPIAGGAGSAGRWWSDAPPLNDIG
jgi:hypothetical protein